MCAGDVLLSLHAVSIRRFRETRLGGDGTYGRERVYAMPGGAA